MARLNTEASLGHILLVDDEVHITDLLQYNLESEHYIVTVEPNAARATKLDLSDVCLMLVDAMGQKFSGMDFLVAVKAGPATAHIPVIIVTHDDSEDEILRAFDAGADDYVLKPFSLRELVARIRSLLRRRNFGRQTPGPAMIIDLGALSIDLLTRTVTVGGEHVALTKTEYAVLALLAKNRGQFFSRRQIYDEIWRDVERGNNDRIVDTNISRIRKKLGDLGSLIVNKSGFGYTIA